MNAYMHSLVITRCMPEGVYIMALNIFVTRIWYISVHVWLVIFVGVRIVFVKKIDFG